MPRFIRWYHVVGLLLFGLILWALTTSGPSEPFPIIPEYEPGMEPVGPE